MSDILIIDDNSDFAEWLAEGLAQDGYTTRSAPDGRAGLKAIGSAAPDLVIVDVRLPDIDGFAVCECIRKNRATAHVPVILVSGVYKEIEHKEKGYALGADDFLVKPFSHDQLRVRVSHLLRRT